MNKFKLGEKVICNNDSDPDGKNRIPFGIKKGVSYTVIGFDKCEFCGLEFILLNTYSGSRKECLCCNAAIFPENGFASFRFKSLKQEQEKKVEVCENVSISCL
jgi:hypothetical protein